MYTGVPNFPEYSVNDVLDQLAVVLGDVPGLLAVYPYRSMNTSLARVAAVTSIRVGLANSPAGVRMAYDYLVDVLVQANGDLETAERTLNDLDETIWRSLWGERLPYWQDCYPYSPTDKPASPQALTGWRRAILYVRVIPN